jgi:hypothetical protein
MTGLTMPPNWPERVDQSDAARRAGASDQLRRQRPEGGNRGDHAGAQHTQRHDQQAGLLVEHARC